MKDAMMIGEALRSALGEERFKEIRDTQRLSEAWGEIAGKKLGKRTRPMSLKKGRLLVRAESAAWSAELHMKKEAIMREAMKKLGIEIKEVSVTVGK